MAPHTKAAVAEKVVENEIAAAEGVVEPEQMVVVEVIAAVIVSVAHFQVVTK